MTDFINTMFMDIAHHIAGRFSIKKLNYFCLKLKNYCLYRYSQFQGSLIFQFSRLDKTKNAYVNVCTRRKPTNMTSASATDWMKNRFQNRFCSKIALFIISGFLLSVLVTSQVLWQKWKAVEAVKTQNVLLLYYLPYMIPQNDTRAKL